MLNFVQRSIAAIGLLSISLLLSGSRAAIAQSQPSPVIISECRFKGANGTFDEFVELYNNTNAPVTVTSSDGTSGWAVVASDGRAIVIILNGTVIPTRGHYLIFNSNGYSLLAYPG
jgi:hypothetical protein